VSTAAPVLSLRGIGKSFGSVEILKGIDLDVRSGVRHLIIGPNGAGKTTLFNVVTGQLTASAGSIEFLGSDVTTLPPHRRARAGLGRTFQIASLFPHLAVWDNLLLAANAPGLLQIGPALAAERADNALGICGLESRRDVVVATLSYGEQRRLEIALTLAAEPKMLLLDEPMAGLTQEERQVLAERIVELSRSVTILLIDHDLEIAMRIAERVTVLDLGRIVCDGAPDFVLADPTVRRIYLGERQ
jgi:ABC-type branched-subunit amino acid transport system ATPase component